MYIDMYRLVDRLRRARTGARPGPAATRPQGSRDQSSMIPGAYGCAFSILIWARDGVLPAGAEEQKAQSVMLLRITTKDQTRSRPTLATEPQRDPSPAQLRIARSRERSRPLQKPERASDRRAGPPATACRLQRAAIETPTHPRRSRLLGRPIPDLAEMEGSPLCRSARDGGALAPDGLSALLAIHLQGRAWAASDLTGAAGSDPAHRQGERLASTEDPSRAREARPQRQPGDRISLSAEARAPGPPTATMDDLPSKPPRRDRRDGLPRRADRSIQAALRVVRDRARATTSPALQRHGPPDLGVDDPAAPRGVPERPLPPVPDPRQRLDLLGARRRGDRVPRNRVQANRLPKSVAERDRGALDRIGSPRTPGSRGCARRAASAATTSRVRRVLQRRAGPHSTP